MVAAGPSQGPAWCIAAEKGRLSLLIAGVGVELVWVDVEAGEQRVGRDSEPGEGECAGFRFVTSQRSGIICAVEDLGVEAADLHPDGLLPDPRDSPGFTGRFSSTRAKGSAYGAQPNAVDSHAEARNHAAGSWGAFGCRSASRRDA